MKRLVYLFGFLLAVVSLIFVSLSLIQNAEDIDITKLSPDIMTGMVLLGILYGVINLLLALAWCELLRHLGQSVGRTWTIWVYGVSQLAKYVPGNLFHFAGRQAIGVSAGLPNGSLAKSVVWELVTLALVALPFAFLPVPLVLNDSIWLVPSILMFGGYIFAIAFLARRFFSIHLSHAALIYTTFLLASAFIFTAIVIITLSLTPTGSMLLAICGAYVIALLAGLITPGAPAGIGVREVVLYALLHTIINQPDLLLVISIGRLVTVGGDLLYFFVAILLRIFQLRTGKNLGAGSLHAVSR